MAQYRVQAAEAELARLQAIGAEAEKLGEAEEQLEEALEGLLPEGGMGHNNNEDDFSFDFTDDYEDQEEKDGVSGGKQNKGERGRCDTAEWG